MKLILFVLCTSTAMVMAQIPEAVVRPGFVPHDRKNKILGLCESDCDRDSECQPGLICADAHKKELRKIGLDERAANCYNVVKPRKYEVCFDANILKSGGAGGGKSWVCLVLLSISFFNVSKVFLCVLLNTFVFLYLTFHYY
jgi:hypothetical protein